MRGKSRRILLLGATGTIGRATLAALQQREYSVVSISRRHEDAALADADVRLADMHDPASLARLLKGEYFDALISCMASRTGAPDDAWSVDYQAHLNVLQAAQAAGIAHFVLLSAICVQKPLLPFQQAKLAFEKCLIDSGMRFSIVRPTAFFKSLSGQFARVKAGKSFLLFGDGQLTACKPISNADLANFLISCLHDESRWNRILPIGGPGSPVTPRQQGERLFALLGRTPRFRSVPIGLLDAIVMALSALGRIAPSLAKKAELARIGRYYATESMLVWDAEAGCYDATATPSTGAQTLFDFYADLARGEVAPERGDHAVF